MPGIQIVGGASGVTAEVETNTRAIRIAQRPIDPLALGAYAIAHNSGVMAAGLAANSPIFSFRWADATRLAVLRSIRLSACEGTVGFGRGVATFYATIARSFSASDTGGIAINMSGNTGKKRTSFGTSLISGSSGDIRGSVTATLTAGTRTLDAMPIGAFTVALGFTGGIMGSTVATGYSFIPPNTALWSRDTGDEYPFVFAQNEGFVITTTVPATGTWGFTTSVEWLETSTFLLLASIAAAVFKLFTPYV